MEDKCIMEDLLMSVKGVCDLYMHGTIESPTSNIHAAFNNALSESLNIQDNIYKQMTDKGWYPTEQVDIQKINQLKQKFAMQI